MVTMSLPLLSISESAPFGSLSAKHFKCINGGKLKSSTQFTPRKMYRINAIAQVDVGVRNWVQANRSALANAVLVGALSLSISLCGLAVRDFWQVDENTIVFVADPTFGNILNFNVGASVDLDVPRSFWSRLAGKYGNLFYWREKGEDASIEAAVSAITTCLREPSFACSEIK